MQQPQLWRDNQTMKMMKKQKHRFEKLIMPLEELFYSHVWRWQLIAIVKDQFSFCVCGNNVFNQYASVYRLNAKEGNSNNQRQSSLLSW
mmetsp:Transcript_31757/g.47435  ORF Transcript_31757/g.47435 Transcript_31757/m.47435 type:complete len:89 (+) Transcript_31757:1095-1361(+)